MSAARPQVFSVDPSAPKVGALARAAHVIRRGGLVAFPTETVYGLGANALNPEAVRGIFSAKERPAYDPLIVHVANPGALRILAREVSPLAEVLAARFWPGPLTLVLPRQACVPDVVTAGGDTVAVRMPAHAVALALIRLAGVPIAAPSANRFGRVSPTRAEHVLADLGGRIDVLLDAGPTPVGVESTVLSLAGPTPIILRPGGVSREALEQVLGDVALSGRDTVPDETAPSPGMLSQHYAPQGTLTVYRGPAGRVISEMRHAAQAYIEQGLSVGMLLAAEEVADFSDLPVEIAVVGPGTALDEVAQQLFAALRALDEAGVAMILAHDFGTAGLGLAIRDRLTRAAGGRVVEV